MATSPAALWLGTAPLLALQVLLRGAKRGVLPVAVAQHLARVQKQLDGLKAALSEDYEEEELRAIVLLSFMEPERYKVDALKEDLAQLVRKIEGAESLTDWTVSELRRIGFRAEANTLKNGMTQARELATKRFCFTKALAGDYDGVPAGLVEVARELRQQFENDPALQAFQAAIDEDFDFGDLDQVERELREDLAAEGLDVDNILRRAGENVERWQSRPLAPEMYEGLGVKILLGR